MLRMDAVDFWTVSVRTSDSSNWGSRINFLPRSIELLNKNKIHCFVTSLSASSTDPLERLTGWADQDTAHRYLVCWQHIHRDLKVLSVEEFCRVIVQRFFDNAAVHKQSPSLSSTQATNKRPSGVQWPPVRSLWPGLSAANIRKLILLPHFIFWNDSYVINLTTPIQKQQPPSAWFSLIIPLRV